jgi:hypothetical protein
MEAKASAAIIGSMPPAVMIIVYMMTPDYISLLWTHPTGRLMLAGSVDVDEHRRSGHEENDQLRFLMVRHDGRH